MQLRPASIASRARRRSARRRGSAAACDSAPELLLIGRSAALAALASVFPLSAAKEAFAQSAKPEKTKLKVGFIPITCATPIIMAADGLLREARARRRGGEDGRLGRDPRQDPQQGIRRGAHARPCRSPSRVGVGANAVPYTMPAVENINGQAITLAVKHKDKRDPAGRASSSPCRSTTRCTTTCFATTSPSTASTRTATSRSARCRRRRWWRTCAPTTSTAFSRRIR